ncbi:Fe-S center protein [Candidatus Magnetoovum chiemensis]|nr:Fe-S center protein [Candidatus Magnetoovum chiemensis]
MLNWLNYEKGVRETSKVWFIDVRGTDFTPSSHFWQSRINGIIETILHEANPGSLSEPALIKTHIGEPRCVTRMLPQYCLSTVKFLRALSINRIVCGDTTVAYAGDRGYYDNLKDCAKYLSLAQKHGWSKDGVLGIPFVVLDRPATSIKDVFEFDREDKEIEPSASRLYRKVYMSGGFDLAQTVINHVHLTLHDMAQVACAVKGITMGASSRKGKLIMHKCFYPRIDEYKCLACGVCADKCPERALIWENGELPRLKRQICIGCGECAVVCSGGAITMSTSEIQNWLHGADTMPFRMADYILAMMSGKWHTVINIAHLYNITKRCDCVSSVQEPICPHIGFLISQNPFAIDSLALSLLNAEIYKMLETGKINSSAPIDKDRALEKVFFDDNYHGSGYYEKKTIQQQYGVIVEPETVVITAY